MERILILSMGFGTGHNQTAKVLCSSFQQLPGVYAEAIDLLELIPKTFHPILQNGYTGMLRRFPVFYHYLYDWTHQSKVIRYVSSEFIEKMGWTIRKKMNQLLYDWRPTKIVTTHPFTLLVLPSKWKYIPSVGVVTDYELHPMWLMRVPDVVCLPKGLLHSASIERIRWKTGARFVETGIPIQHAFYDDVSQEYARQQLGLNPDQPVVIVMGGGAGLGPLEDLVSELRPFSHFQFAIMTGKNEKLFQSMKQKYQEPHLHIKPYCQDIPLWMSAADLLVTKPGGVTVSEAIAKRLPMFLFEAFPGQEEANQRFMIHRGVGIATSPSSIRSQMNHFFDPKNPLAERMKKRFSSLLSPYSAEEIVKETLKLSTVHVNIL